MGTIVDAVLHLPQTIVFSPALDALVGAGVLPLEPARESWIDLRQVGGASEIIDLRPILPLRFMPVERSMDPVVN